MYQPPLWVMLLAGVIIAVTVASFLGIAVMVAAAVYDRLAGTREAG